jgi:hypothetical protein
MKVYVVMAHDPYFLGILRGIYAVKERAEEEVKILREDEARTSEERRLRHSPELWRGDDLLCTYEVIERELIE